MKPELLLVSSYAYRTRLLVAQQPVQMLIFITILDPPYLWVTYENSFINEHSPPFSRSILYAWNSPSAEMSMTCGTVLDTSHSSQCRSITIGFERE